MKTPFKWCKNIYISKIQGSNYLFRSDPRRFREKLESMGERFKPPPPHWGFGAKLLSKCKKKIVYSLIIFGVRYKRFKRQKLCGFPEDKNSNRRKLLTR